MMPTLAKHVENTAPKAGAMGTPFFGKDTHAPYFQPKLTVNTPGDEYEQEADAVADQVMRMPAYEPSTDKRGGDSPIVQRMPLTPLNGVMRMCSECAEKEEEKNGVQRKESGGGNARGKSAPPIVSDVLSSGGGQSMDGNTRQFMESRFGQDFSAVRIHTGSRAAESAVAIQARAYTSGKDVVFGSGEYQPGSEQGKRLLAHELVHVGQQGGGNGSIQRQVESINIDCGSNSINFNADQGVQSYGLEDCDVTPGTYESSVQIPGGWTTGANGRRIRSDIGWTLLNAPENTRFNFNYNIRPGQMNPRDLFRGQSRVRIISTNSLASIFDPLQGTSSQNPLSSIPVIYEAVEITLPTSLGAGAHILAMGNVGALGRGGQLLGPSFWRSFIPRSDVIILDRVVNQLPRDLMPLIQTQTPVRWLTEFGYSESQLANIPDLVRRLNQGGTEALTATELQLLRRAAELHIGGTTPGSPLVSYMQPNAPAPNVGNRMFRVRIEVPRSQALDVSGVNPFNQGAESLTNSIEQEVMLVANHEGRIINVQSIAEAGSEAGSLMRSANTIRWGGRVLIVASLAMSGYRISQAQPGRERRRVIGEETGGQVLGFAGTVLGAAGCVALGIATGGLGLLACGLVGGIGLGIIGSNLGGAIADSMEEPQGTPAPFGSGPPSLYMGSTVCPNCHQTPTSSPMGSVLSPPFSARHGMPGNVFSQQDLTLLSQWLESQGHER